MSNLRLVIVDKFAPIIRDPIKRHSLLYLQLYNTFVTKPGTFSRIFFK